MKKLTAGDMFCGFGGTTEGMIASNVVDVRWAINHDPKAIEAHRKNHPNLKHYIEDIIDMDEHRLEPVDILWASLECTHFSGAKGGQDRDPDSRMLGDQLYRYIDHCDPIYVMIENVREFKSWGPLTCKRDEKGKIMADKNGRRIRIPDPKQKGRYYRRWIRKIRDMGYVYRSKMLNAADFGAHTSRTRYFGIFAKIGYPIRFPSQTHHKDGVNGYEKWRPVKEVLNLDDEGNSVFGRKKALAENTMKRIAHGIWKHVLNDDEKNFIASVFTSGGQLRSTDDPLRTIDTRDRHQLITVEKRKFLTAHFHNMVNSQSIEKPMPTIITKDQKQQISVDFISNGNYGQGRPDKVKSIDEPLPTITTQNRLSKVSVDKKKFIGRYYGGPDNAKRPPTNSIERPLNTITAVDHHHIVSVDKKKFITPQYGKSTSKSLKDPLGAITTNRHDQLISVEKRQFILKYFGSGQMAASIHKPLGSVMPVNKDALTTVDILDQMIVDIKMRFLQVPELAKAQGFPDDYYLGGNKREQTKYIGNSVPPVFGKLIAEANVNAMK